MEKSILIKNKTAFFKQGTVLRNVDIDKKGNAIFHDDFIDKKDFIVLNEELTREDKLVINSLINNTLEKLFWRLYTRGKFLLK